MKQQNWLTKAYKRLLWHLKELNKTFSNEPSYYSAKRVMEFILFTNAVVLFDWYVIRNFDKLTFAEMCEAFMLNLGYAGYVRFSTQREKKKIIKNESTNNPTPDNTGV